MGKSNGEGIESPAYVIVGPKLAMRMIFEEVASKLSSVIVLINGLTSTVRGLATSVYVPPESVRSTLMVLLCAGASS